MGLAGLAGGRSWQLVHELAKFGVIGVLAVLVAAIGTNLLHFQTGMGPLTSNVIATVVSTVVSYLGNRYWTFRHRQRTTVSREGVQVHGAFGMTDASPIRRHYLGAPLAVAADADPATLYAEAAG